MKKVNVDEQLMKKTCAIAAILAALLLYVFLYSPMEKETLFLSKENRALKKEISMIRSIIKDHQADKNQRIFLEENEVTGIVQEIMSTGELYDIEFVSISLENVQRNKKDQYHHQSLNMDIHADYQNYGEFLDALLDFKDGAIAVRSFTVSRDEAIEPLVQSALVVDIFLKDEKSGKK